MTSDSAGSPKAFTSYDVQMSLFDQDRVMLFRSAIAQVVRPGDVVVDGGSGTGLLGMLAAKAGAARVYCVEKSEEYVDVISENARRNGLSERVIPIHADASMVSLPEQVDVIICEVMSAGFFYEPQLEIVHHLRRFLKATGTVIPAASGQFVDLMCAQETLYGLKFTYESRWKTLNDVILSETTRYLFTDFHSSEAPKKISASAVVAGIAAGNANAVRVTYNLHFTSTLIAAKPSEFLLNPQIIFLADEVPVSPGRRYHLSLDYETASNPRDCQITVREALG